jgi:integrase
MKRKKYAGWTIAGTLSTLSLVMARARRAGYAQANPVVQLDKGERPKIQASAKRALDEAEIAKLLTEAGDTFRPLIAFMLFTGVRIGEALGCAGRILTSTASESMSDRSSAATGSWPT